MAQRIHIWAQCLSFPRFHYSVVGMLFCVSDIFCLVFGCLSVYTRTEVVSNGVILRLAEAVAQVNCKLIVQFWNLSIDLELFLFFLNYRKTPQSTFLIYNIYMFHDSMFVSCWIHVFYQHLCTLLFQVHAVVSQRKLWVRYNAEDCIFPSQQFGWNTQTFKAMSAALRVWEAPQMSGLSHVSRAAIRERDPAWKIPIP